MTLFRFASPADPLNEWQRLARRMDDLFQALGPSGADWPGVYPPVNLSEDADRLYLRAELPGVAAKDLEISVEGENLILKGKRSYDEPEGVSYHRRERTAGVFRRVITLPVQVQADKVAASLKDGVLTINLPKADEVKPRQIQVVAA